MQFSFRYTVVFAALVCIVCSVLVSTAAVTLRDRQEENKLLDQRKKVLAVAGLLPDGEELSREEINRRFLESLEPRIVDLETGEYVDGIDPNSFNQRKASTDPATSKPAGDNPAKVRRIPKYALVYLMNGGRDGVIIPIEGMGLWSTLYGYLALGPDARTVKGIIFYEHGETPGLGGEVENPQWRALWPGRKVYDEEGRPALAVIKGKAGPPDSDPYHVDGLSGATLTSNGVTNLLRFWLGDRGFKPYLERFQQQEG